MGRISRLNEAKFDLASTFRSTFKFMFVVTEKAQVVSVGPFTEPSGQIFSLKVCYPGSCLFCNRYGLGVTATDGHCAHRGLITSTALPLVALPTLYELAEILNVRVNPRLAGFERLELANNQ
jgi:hypothetical protein